MGRLVLILRGTIVPEVIDDYDVFVQCNRKRIRLRWLEASTIETSRLNELPRYS